MISDIKSDPEMRSSELAMPPTQSGAGAVAPKFVLITPARNEAALIELTIQGVIRQTVRPVRWLIVSDGSTDGTDEIVKRYASEHSWIELIRMPERQERHFAGKVHAFNAAYARVQNSDYDVIGSLDADITFDEGYFEFLLKKFVENQRLGVAGTPFREEGHQYDYRFTSIEHVSGACQLFRRQCFEDVGGYVPIKIGGIDLVAVMTARMKGWETRTFPEMACFHHRQMGTAKQTSVMVAYRGGKGDFVLGGHPVWEFFRCIYQLTQRPVLLGGMFRLAGFTGAMLSGQKKLVSDDLVRFRRAEQMRRLKDFANKVARGRISRPSAPSAQ
jgi:poly-beta-1,6-N-acetyl-D-glucosamine synthase